MPSKRIKGNPEGLVQSLGENRYLPRRTVCAYSAKDLDLARLALRQKEVAVRSSADQARIVQLAGVELHLESSRRNG